MEKMRGVWCRGLEGGEKRERGGLGDWVGREEEKKRARNGFVSAGFNFCCALELWRGEDELLLSTVLDNQK